jgi:hypothetical protein
MMSATGLPIAFEPGCDHACYNMHPIAHPGLGSECEDLNPTAVLFGQPRRSPRCPFWNTEGQRGRKLQTTAFRDKRALRSTYIEACMKARMIVENYKLKLLRPMPLAQLCMSVALLSTTASPALSSQGTPEQRLACTPDVFRLCSAFIPNADEITICLRARTADLTDACRAALEAGLKQPPNAGDNTQFRNRTTK